MPIAHIVQFQPRGRAKTTAMPVAAKRRKDAGTSGEIKARAA